MKIVSLYYVKINNHYFSLPFCEIFLDLPLSLSRYLFYYLGYNTL